MEMTRDRLERCLKTKETIEILKEMFKTVDKLSLQIHGNQIDKYMSETSYKKMIHHMKEFIKEDIDRIEEDFKNL